MTNKSFIPTEMRDSNGFLHKETIFWPNAQAEYAKAVVFAAEAHIAIAKKQYIWSAISTYYSLFHLTISLIYTTPIYLEQKKLTKLIDARQGGKADPMPKIRHADLPQFLQNCETHGLSIELRQELSNARELREFVNYRPQVEWQGERLFFRTKEHKLNQVLKNSQAVEPLLNSTFKWALQQNDNASLVTTTIFIGLPSFFENEDLLYKEWCSLEVLEEIEQIQQRLDVVKIRHFPPDLTT